MKNIANISTEEKYLVNRRRRQAMNKEKLFAKDTSNKEPLSKIYKELKTQQEDLN